MRNVAESLTWTITIVWIKCYGKSEEKHIKKKFLNIIIIIINWNYMFALMCNGVLQQNILVLYNRHHKQSQHVSHTDVVELKFYSRYRQAPRQRILSVFSPKQARHKMNCRRRPIDCLLRIKIAPWVIDVDISILTNCFDQSSCISVVVFSHDYWRLSEWACMLWCLSSSCTVLQPYFKWSEGSVGLTVPFRPII